MKKVYLFSENYNAEFIKDLGDTKNQLEIIPSLKLSAEQALAKEFDYILLLNGEFVQFRNLIGAIGWKTNQLGVADALVRVEGGYKPINLNADCVLQTLRQRSFKLDTLQSIVVIGYYDFVLSVAVKMALSGYSNIIISVVESHKADEVVKKMKDFIFNINIKAVDLNDLTFLQTTSGLLISNVTPEVDKDVYETLTYFNFLSQKGVFVDFSSYSNPILIEEAKKAELNVVEELEILTLKFKSLLEN